MPPKSKLSDRQIADLVRWVEDGSYRFQLLRRKKRPQSRPQSLGLPAAGRSANTRGQEFRMAAVAARPFHPGRSKRPDCARAAADKRTLIRRATFDLTGPAADARGDRRLPGRRSARRVRQVVDRLLASPAYGERWGRHWLDVARYADSNGLDENVAHGNAWRYRDYVVAAFNRDKPYDQFLLEQLAGDLLPAATIGDAAHEQLIATGFLALGPKVLAEVDENKMEMDIVDEQIDTVGRAFLGLTLGCARCHDHKFDPIPTDDYYALAGIFKSTRTMENFKKIATWHENPLPTRRNWRTQGRARAAGRRARSRRSRN